MRPLGEDPVSVRTQSFVFNGAFGSFYAHTTIKDVQPGMASFSPSPYDITYKFNATMAVVVLVLVGAFLAIGIFAFYMKKCVLSSGEDDLLLQRRTAAAAAAAAARPESASKGLNREVLDKFPVVPYSTVEVSDHKHTTDCAVCLTEFQEGENVRLLPACNHSFHPDCIDLWLDSHTTCPLCRISLVPQPEVEIQTQVQMPVMAAAAGDDDQADRSEESSQENTDAICVLSRSSESFRRAVQEVEMRQRTTAVTASFESGSSSRWMSKLMRSISMEASRPARVASPEATSAADDRKISQESCHITIEKGRTDATEGSSKTMNADRNLLARTWNSALQHSISFRQFRGLPALDPARPTNSSIL